MMPRFLAHNTGSSLMLNFAQFSLFYKAGPDCLNYA